MRHPIALLTAVLLCLAGPARAQPAALTPQQFRGVETLVVFWRSDCAPCLTETAMLPELARAHPALRIALVALTSKSAEAGALPRDLPGNVTLLDASADTEATLAGFGNLHGGLPYSALLGKDGSICAARAGLLGSEWVDRWSRAC